MTAPRACRSCGTPLPRDVRWCLRCYAPVAELTPRPSPPPPLDTAEEPPAWVNRSPLRDIGGAPPTYSRWRAGPTTFGPVGRLVITAVVMLVFPWDALFTFNPLRLWFLLGYTIFASYVLRHTWRRERVMVEVPRHAGRIRRALDAHAGPLSRSIDARALIALAGAGAAAGAVFAWMTFDRIGRFGLVAAGAVAVGALIWAWWTET
jgi:hypothetical protein